MYIFFQFCMCSSAIWLLIAGIGSFLSGMTLIYLLTMILLTLPGAYIHLVTSEQKFMIMQILNSVYLILMPPGILK